MTPATSVVIPCCNSEQWLAAALDCVNRQTCPPTEVIVLVDSSHDRSEAIARAHPVGARVVTTSFRNAAATRNHGVSLARGEWVAFLDADDWWTDRHLEIAHGLLMGTRDVAYFGHFIEYFQNAREWLEQEPLFGGEARAGLTSDDFYRFFLGPNSGWPTSGMVIQTARFREVGGFDVTQIRRHDTELFARVVFQRTWSYSPRPVFVYRKDVDTSISQDRAACSYFRFLADQKIAHLYGPGPAQERLRKRAAICMSDALSAPSAAWLLQESGRRCLPHLDWVRTVFYRAALRAPGPCRRLQNAALAVKHKRAARRPSGRSRGRSRTAPYPDLAVPLTQASAPTA